MGYTYESTGNKHCEANHSCYQEDDNGESQRSGLNFIVFLHVTLPVNGSNSPWKTKTKVHIYCIGASNIGNSCISI